MDDYLIGRMLVDYMFRGLITMRVTAGGVLLGAIFRSHLWIAPYDIPVPKKVHLRDFADNAAASIVADSVLSVKHLVKFVLRKLAL